MYDFFQRTESYIGKETFVYDIFDEKICLIEKYKQVDEDVLAKVYEDEVHMATIRFTEETMKIKIIDYYYLGTKIKTSIYDSSGFLSSNTFFEEGKVFATIFYDVEEKDVITYFFKDSKVFSIVVKSGETVNVLENENSLYEYFFGMLLKKGDIVIIDREEIRKDVAPIIISLFEVKRDLEIKIFNVIHTDNIARGQKRSVFKHMLKYESLINGFVFNTESQKIDIIKYFDIKKQDEFLSVIASSPSIRTDIVRKNNKNKIIVIGRLAKVKRMHHVIEAFSIILGEINDAELHILGSGREEAFLKKITKKLGLKKSVKFKGLVKREGLLDELKTSKLHLFSSKSESLPVVLLETASLGIPTVSYDIKYGPSEIIDHGVTGYLTKENPEELAKYAIRLLKDEELYASFSKKLYEKTHQNFSEEVIFEKWKEVLNS